MPFWRYKKSENHWSITLLYKRWAKSAGRPKVRHLKLPHFSTDFNETWNQKRYRGYHIVRKIWLMWDDGAKICVKRAFSVTFCFLLVCPKTIACGADLSFSADVLLVRPKTIVFGRTYVLAQMFFFSLARSPRCVGRLTWNFARWVVLGTIL